MTQYRNTRTGRTVEMATEVAATINNDTIRLWNFSDVPFVSCLIEDAGLWATVDPCPDHMSGFKGLFEIPVWSVSDSELPDELENGHASDGRFISPVDNYTSMRGEERTMTRGQLSNVNHNRFLRHDHSGHFSSK